MTAPPHIEQHHGDIDALVARLYSAFRTRGGVEPALHILREVLLPDALIVKAVSDDPDIFDVTRFIDTRRAILTGGALVDFDEYEIDARTVRVGHVAHRWSLYRKTGTLDGVPFDTLGTKSLQCVDTAGGWRIASLAWDETRAGLSLPADWPWQAPCT